MELESSIEIVSSGLLLQAFEHLLLRIDRNVLGTRNGDRNLVVGFAVAGLNVAVQAHRNVRTNHILDRLLNRSLIHRAGVGVVNLRAAAELDVQLGAEHDIENDADGQKAEGNRKIDLLIFTEVDLKLLQRLHLLFQTFRGSDRQRATSCAAA